MSRLFVAACLAVLFAAGSTRALEKIEVGKPAPNFQATTFNGQKVSLADYRGQVLIINYWATWCGPCRKEMPLLDSYLRQQGARGLKVLAVTDENSLPLSRLKPLSKVVALDMAWRFRGAYDAPREFPTNYVIGRDGVVRYSRAGAFDLDTLNSVIVPLLNQPPPPPLASRSPASSTAPDMADALSEARSSGP